MIAPLFADEFQQPLRLVGPLHAALARLPHGGFSTGANPRQYDDDVIAAAGPAGFDYAPDLQRRGANPAAAGGVGVVARTPLLTLVDVRPLHG